MKFSIEEFESQLPLPANEKWKDGVWFKNAFIKGDFQLEFFAPNGKDYQTAHEQDEFYIIVRGSATLIKGNESFNCKTGDALYVETGVSHHFEEMSPDFATWVIFFQG